MEHIERAGFTQGTQWAVYPPQTLSKKIQETIADYTKRLAIGLNCIGMMNIQFVIQGTKRSMLSRLTHVSSRTVTILV